MSLAIWVIIGFLSCQLSLLVYAVAQAIVGRSVGAFIEEIAVGIGPTVFSKSIGGTNWTIRLIPCGSSTKFYNRDVSPGEAGVTSEADKGIRFVDLPASRRLAIMLVGPFALIAIGACFAAMPVFLGADQVVVDDTLPDRFGKVGIPHLTVEQRPTTPDGQCRFFVASTLQYIVRLFSFQSMEGYSGFVGWIATLGSVGQYSPSSFLSCFGVTLVGLGVANLIPIPTLNGGHIVVILFQMASGKLTDRTIERMTICGLILILVLFVRIVLLDLYWFTGLHR